MTAKNHRGKTAVIPWPEVRIGEQKETVHSYERSGQSVIDAWGAARRAFLSSCMEDREWMEDEKGTSEKFHGDTQRAGRRYK
jgi:hypothetical protein